METKVLRLLALSFIFVILMVASVRGVNEKPLVKAAEISPTQVAANQTPSGDYWTTEASMPIVRSGLGVATVDGKIYAIGGRNGDTILATNQQYDPATNQWTNREPMPTPRYNFAVAVYDGKIFCIGGVATWGFYQDGVGYNLSKANEIYDPATDTWTTEAPMPRGSDGKACVVNGEIYVMSGIVGLQLNQVYNPATGQWSTKTPIPDRDGYCAAAAVIGNKIYVIGGYDDTLSHNIVQIYDTTSDSWTAGSSPPAYMGGNIAGAVTVGSPDSQRIDLFGITGYASTVNNGSTSNQIYDSSTDSWTVLTSMPTSRTDLGLAVLGNEIYALGGSMSYLPFSDDTGGSTWYFSTNERYTLPASIAKPTLSITPMPTTNATVSSGSESGSQPVITAEEVAVGAVAVFVAVAVLAVFLVSRRKLIKDR